MGRSAVLNCPRELITRPMIQVLNPKALPLWSLPVERIPVGIPGDYKPSMVILPDGELVMVAFFVENPGGGKIRERTVLWRSSDGGRTWSERKVLENVIGREPWLTLTSNGMFFMTSHLLTNDINNTEGVNHAYVHRSVDGGRSWQRTKVFLTGEERRGVLLTSLTVAGTSRNVVELSDGTLLLGVGICSSGVAYLWTSKDNGETWEHGEPVSIGHYDGKPYDNLDAFFTEDFTYLTRSGKLLHWLRCGPSSPMFPIPGTVTPVGDDEVDRTLICESTDGGRSWDKIRDFGRYGMHYVKPLRLQDGRLLITYTQRAIFYPIGLRAILCDEECQSWDFEHDQVIIEGKTPWGAPSGGGFGNTVQLKEGTLVSCYTYRGEDNLIHLEVVRWSLPV